MQTSLTQVTDIFHENFPLVNSSSVLLLRAVSLHGVLWTALPSALRTLKLNQLSITFCAIKIIEVEGEAEKNEAHLFTACGGADLRCEDRGRRSDRGSAEPR